MIFTGDWSPDGGNLLKQARQMGLGLPFANLYMTEPNSLSDVGVEGTKGLVIHHTVRAAREPRIQNGADKKYYKMWFNLWETKWQKPYILCCIKNPMSHFVVPVDQPVLWLLSVVERAKTTDAHTRSSSSGNGDTYRYF